MSFTTDRVIVSPKPRRALPAAVAFVALFGSGVRADTTLDSGTTTVSTGTDFGQNLYVGSSGTATLRLLAGANVTNADGWLGYGAGSLGVVAVSGGTWTNSHAIYVGVNGVGMLGVDGGIVTNAYGFIGAGPGSTGTASVTSGTWATGASLSIGYFGGAGTLTVTGGRVTATDAYLGSYAGSAGAAAVSSGTWASDVLYVGYDGAGVIEVSGGMIADTSGHLGYVAGSRGAAVVSGGAWVTSGELNVGTYGSGRLDITGGRVATSNGCVGAYAGSAGVSTITGGTWTNSNFLMIGDGGTGTLTMNGGLVSVSGTLAKGIHGTITLNSGGTLQIGTGTTDGVLGMNALTNDGTLIFDRSSAYTYSGTISGTGAVIKRGAGTLTLSGSNGLAGPTTIQQGVLKLDGPVALASSALAPLSGGTVTLAPYLQTSVGGLNPHAGGLVDVGNGMVAVAAGLSAADLVAAIVSGYGDGTWSGTSGITSSTAAADVSADIPRAIGWLDAGGGSVTFGYAAPGDTNLDGVIDIIDAANMLSGGRFDSGQASSWNQGDFNYDGIVDVLDVAALNATDLYDAGPYNTPMAAVAHAVPEPASCVIVAIAGMGVSLLTIRSNARYGSGRAPEWF